MTNLLYYNGKCMYSGEKCIKVNQKVSECDGCLNYTAFKHYVKITEKKPREKESLLQKAI